MSVAGFIGLIVGGGLLLAGLLGWIFDRRECRRDRVAPNELEELFRQ